MNVGLPYPPCDSGIHLGKSTPDASESATCRTQLTKRTESSCEQANIAWPVSCLYITASEAAAMTAIARAVSRRLVRPTTLNRARTRTWLLRPRATLERPPTSPEPQARATDRFPGND